MPQWGQLPWRRGWLHLHLPVRFPRTPLRYRHRRVPRASVPERGSVCGRAEWVSGPEGTCCQVQTSRAIHTFTSALHHERTLRGILSSRVLVSDTDVTALTQPSQDLTVRHHHHPATLNPASTAPPAGTSWVATLANAGQVNETQTQFIEGGGRWRDLSER